VAQTCSCVVDKTVELLILGIKLGFNGSRTSIDRVLIGSVNLYKFNTIFQTRVFSYQFFKSFFTSLETSSSHEDITVIFAGNLLNESESYTGVSTSD
jgi:hypothetical protein